jgi:hypothetical protein
LNITKYSDIEKYGIDAIMEPIVDAVKELENVSMELYTTLRMSKSNYNIIWKVG